VSLKKKKSKGQQQIDNAEVIMLSGCKDTQTSADVSAGSMGVAKAAGAMTTAFRHTISPDIACEDLLVRMRSFLKQNGYDQVPQMSSEQFVQLDSSFVGYAVTKRTKRGLPPTLSPPAQTAPFQTRQQAAPTAPMSTPARPQQSMHLDTEKYVMDTRIHKLEEQIAELRKQQQSPPPSGTYDGYAGFAMQQPVAPGVPQTPQNYGMAPGIQLGMQPGMHAGMQPGVQPGMQPCMQPGMQPGMQGQFRQAGIYGSSGFH